MDCENSGFKTIEIYTDGSCNAIYNIGAWAAILFVDDKKIELKGVVENTTHNRMELLAVIKAIDFIDEKFKNIPLLIYTDSQYVFRIPERKEKLKNASFITKKGNELPNSDLVQILIHQIETHSIEFIKVKAHQHVEVGSFNVHETFNSEVDKLARLLVRDAVRQSNY